MALILRTGVRSISEREHVADFHIVQFGSPLYERVNQRRWGTTTLLDPDAVARLDNVDSFLGADHLAPVLVAPANRWISGVFSGHSSIRDNSTCKWVSNRSCFFAQVISVTYEPISAAIGVICPVRPKPCGFSLNPVTPIRR